MNFAVGQRIICIDTFFELELRYRINVPVKFQIYTVRAICPNMRGPAILLHEVHNTRKVRFGNRALAEPSFKSESFRPLFDISELESLLQTAPTPVPA